MEKGNIILQEQELIGLREAICKKYSNLTGTDISQITEMLNSNLNNYKNLYDSIDQVASLKEAGISSKKPLASIFYFSDSERPKPKRTFRKAFIDALYRYAYNMTRGEIISSKNSLLTQYTKIKGYWQAYYSPSNTFESAISHNKEAKLNVVGILIDGLGVNRAEVHFFQNKNWGSGTVEIQGSNLVFQLNSDKNYEPTFLIMNFGKHIQDVVGHIKYTAGICLYINDSGSPKAVHCIMEYFDTERLEEEYQMTKIDRFSDVFKEKFNSSLHVRLDETNIQDRRLRRIISFFKRPHISTDVNISDLTSVD